MFIILYFLYFSCKKIVVRKIIYVHTYISESFKYSNGNGCRRKVIQIIKLWRRRFLAIACMERAFNTNDFVW